MDMVELQSEEHPINGREVLIGVKVVLIAIHCHYMVCEKLRMH